MDLVHRTTSTTAILVGFLALWGVPARARAQESAPGALPPTSALAAHQPWTNTVGTRLVWIPAGSFDMGSPVSEQGRSPDESPRHEVTLRNGVWMGSCEVTQGEWEAVMGVNPSAAKGPRLPVEQVSWTTCVDFCEKLTQRERAAGHLRPGWRYRLPTEAEWEHASRAGDVSSRHGSLDSIAWYADNSRDRTHEVGKKLPNAWGLYDMLGNVAEWCQDWYGAYREGSEVDPLGAEAGAYRVYRGGGYGAVESASRAAYRATGSQDRQEDYLGFRLALEPGTP